MSGNMLSNLSSLCDTSSRPRETPTPTSQSLERDIKEMKKDFETSKSFFKKHRQHLSKDVLVLYFIS